MRRTGNIPMKKLIALLAVLSFMSACSKSNTGNSKYCWTCEIEGYYNGKLVDIDSTICQMTETEIRQFESGHNQNGNIVLCNKQ